ncbi:MAG: co-chaperone GroES [Clostridia bacterium]|nr:co-chaperone GroES [Clostridia bacterium]
MQIKPLFDKVVLKEEKIEETSKSGIFLPVSDKEKPQIATVVSVGEGGIVDGKEVKMVVNLGDKVIFSKYAGSNVKVDNEDYIIVRQADILAILK